MNRWDILNGLIRKNNYKSYLEIGVQAPISCFDAVQCDIKQGIEPFPNTKLYKFPNNIYIGTSDEFFNSIKGTDVKYDIIFIDGLHHDDQVLKDIDNSLNHLNDGGIIMCHDCLPLNEREQQRNDHGGRWMGDVWKAIAKLRMTRDDLKIEVVNTDCGCGLISRGKCELYNFDVNDTTWRTYQFYNENKQELMNVISVNQLISSYF